MGDERASEETVQKGEEVLEEVRHAMLNWIGENKRLEDFRLVEREVQLLSSRLVSATRRTTEVTRKDDSLPAASADELEAESSQPPEPSELCERYAEEQLQFEELSFCYGLRWRSKSSNGVDFHWVTLQLDVQRGDSEQRRLVDFEGHRSSDFRKDEAMHCVDHELVRHLHRWLLPSLASPVLLLDGSARRRGATGGQSA
ncbi:unnamed protein product [Durusdinium trenchii]|uniref:Ubiquitinyl hydrolase 1 n=1 Tax=Durusdinium trenchii TaxID=1381693 RepID=A0ABP0IN96_9DINO